MAAIAHSSHSSWAPTARPHQRGHSTSAISYQTPELRIPGYSGRDSFDSPLSATPSGSGSIQGTHGGHSIKIKPYLRKLSLKGTDSSHTIDLSRPSAENESLAGLGFYHDDSRSASDLAFPSPTFPSPIAARGVSRHQRSTSNNSTFSTASHQRPTAPYAHPMRGIPPVQRTYTAHSLGSDNEDEAIDIMSDDTYRTRLYGGVQPSRRSGSIGSLPHPLLHEMQSSASLTRLNNLSESSLPSSSLPTSTVTSRSRGDTLRSTDSTAASSSARTSMDKAMGFFRQPKTPDENTSEAATRAATIMAARIAFAEKEEAKERKAEKDALKAADRANRKRVAREERHHRKSESGSNASFMATTAAQVAVANASHAYERKSTDFVGLAYADHKPVHSRSLPAHVSTASAQGANAAPSPRWEKAAPGHGSSLKGTWLSFVAWFRTRLLRMKRKLRRSGY
jgi:hypothetical protein